MALLNGHSKTNNNYKTTQNSKVKVVCCCVHVLVFVARLSHRQEDMKQENKLASRIILKITTTNWKKSNDTFLCTKQHNHEYQNYI